MAPELSLLDTGSAGVVHKPDLPLPCRLLQLGCPGRRFNPVPAAIRWPRRAISLIAMPDQIPPAPAAAPAPAKKGNRVLVVILCVILALMLLIGGCVATCFYFGAKGLRAVKAHPQYYALWAAAKANSDVEVVSGDADTGKLTIRVKSSGEERTVNAADFTKENAEAKLNELLGKMRATAQTVAEKMPANPGPGISSGKAEALAGVVAKFPDFMPGYPGASVAEASQNSLGGIRTTSCVFTTGDKADAVIDFYAGKAEAAGFAIAGRTSDTNDNGMKATLSLTRANPQATLTVAAESLEGGTVQVTLNGTEAGR